MNIYGITVDAPANDFKAYCQQMSHYEKEFIDICGFGINKEL